MNIEETDFLSLTKFEGIGPCIYQLIKVQKFLNLFHYFKEHELCWPAAGIT